MPIDPVERLEERVAWLERHVAEQDRAMLELGETIDRLKKEVLRLRDRSSGASDPDDAPPERPPHY